MASAAVEPRKRDWRFWMIFLCVMMSQFLNALEFALVCRIHCASTIVNALHGTQFVWIESAYTLCSTAFVPLSGSLAEVCIPKIAEHIFGRRIFMFVSTVICGIGSALWLIISAVQGLVAGGVASLCQIILSDLVPLKERGIFKYRNVRCLRSHRLIVIMDDIFFLEAIPLPMESSQSLVSFSLSIRFFYGSEISLGGSLAQNGQWRWIFYLNIPICALTALLVVLFLNLRAPPGSFAEKIKKIDLMFVLEPLIVLLPLTLYSSGNFFLCDDRPDLGWGAIPIVFFILRCMGRVVFLCYEFMVAKSPIVPRSLLNTRTVLSGLIQISIPFIDLICLLYYMPVYFQACMDTSPIASGVDIFGFAFSVAPSALIVGLPIARSHQYRPHIWLFGDSSYSSSAKAISFQIIPGVGRGMMTAAANAQAIALYTFFRNFSNILGVTIGGTVLQNELVKRLPPAFTVQFHEGSAIAYSIIPLIRTLRKPLKWEIQVAFAESLRVVWQALVGISCVGLLASLLVKRLPLLTEVDDKWGIDHKKEESEGLSDKVVVRVRNVVASV
ncbi:hypothetical protein B0H19DRAFT_1206342 [Mycena capillaripes]|nr:hypothetical protein B0H19DRAFT_1206342 [Mycena capillaripes]